ncbi:MAG: glucosyl-3-phosphoglycerate synthase [Nitriliruptorales bacterium]|nr:glucosyl-3-phosphoglycerate synthase [Nitriliruptorales bacterium]
MLDDHRTDTITPVGRSFHATDWTIPQLVSAKRERNQRVSVVIPARNEEATVGRVVATLRVATMEATGLVDELIVVDGDSDDDTAAVAAAAGAEVLHQGEILGDAGTAPGKGEALWKGLAASTGDLVVFVDADIHDIDERFVTGLVGPLLHDAGIGFVKAAYDRPFQTTAGIEPSGGGRVTELMARPLLATFWPDLAWLAQPLSGEYAGRRDVLEAVPFVQGWGVELALLIDIADRFGPSVIAQVDLGRRVHDHQGLEALGRMATEILQVAVDRLADEDRLVLTDPVGEFLHQPMRAHDGTLGHRTSPIAHRERPPLADWLRRRADER